MGYYNSSRSYRIFNKCTFCIKKFVHVIFDDNNHIMKNGSSIRDEIEYIKESKSIPSKDDLA